MKSNKFLNLFKDLFTTKLKKIKMAAQPRTSLITHVSSAGQEQIQIIVHAGANLPVSTINDTVKSYVTWYSFFT